MKDNWRLQSVKWLLFLILCLALFLRLWYLFELQSNPLPFVAVSQEAFDQYRFVKLAADIKSGHWVGPIASFSPAYSYLIAVLYSVFAPSCNTIFLFQMSVGVIACFVLYKTGKMVFDRPSVGLLAALLAAAYAPFIFYEAEVLRDMLIGYCNLFAFYFLCAGLMKEKCKSVFFGGWWVGVSAALRLNILALFVVPYLAAREYGNSRLKFKAPLAFILGMLLPFFPLMLRHAVLRDPNILTQRGPSDFWFGNSIDASGLAAQKTPYVENLQKQSQGSALKTGGLFLGELKRHPMDYLRLYGRKIRMFFNGYEIPSNFSFDLFRERSVPLNLSVMDFTIIGPFVILGLLLLAGRSRMSALLYGFCAVLSGSVILYHIQGRYRMAVMPIFILPAAYGMHWFVSRWRQRRFQSAALATLVLIGLFAASRPDTAMIQKYFGGRVRPFDYRNMASAYLVLYQSGGADAASKKSFLRSAAHYLERSTAMEPSVPSLSQLAAVYRELGRNDESRRIEELIKIGGGAK